jgi:type IV fimbrial biogenesis protein FimT
MKKSLGFTLIELLVTLSIMATLVTLAVPSVAGLVQSGNVASAVNTFLADTRYSRAVAARRGATVVICPQATSHDGSPQCAPPSPYLMATDWSSGWLVYENRDGDPGNYDSKTDKLLLVQDAQTGVHGIESQASRIAFSSNGRLVGGPSTIVFGSRIHADRQRLLCMSAMGRGRVAGNGDSSCA